MKKMNMTAMMLTLTMLLTMGGCAAKNEVTQTAEEAVPAQTTAQTAAQTTARTTTAAQTQTTAQTEAVIEAEPASAVQTDGVWLVCDEDDTNEAYASFDAQITLKQNGSTVSGSGVTVEGNTVTITEGGNYRLSGTLTDGQLVIASDQRVCLYLDGAQITNSKGTALISLNEKRLILTLAPDSQNSFTDGSGYSAVTIGEQEIDESAVYVQDKLTINGTGSLTVTGNTKDGIVCKDDLKLVNGNITVQAVNNGIKGKDAAAVFGGSVTITAGNDGLKSTEDTDAAKGFVQLDGGTLHITAEGDAVQAQTFLRVTDGTLELTANGTAIDSETGETASAKGIKANGEITISGGKTTITAAADDGINTDGTAVLSGGELNITAYADGVQADGDLQVLGGTVNITTTAPVGTKLSDDMGGGFGGGMGGGMGRNGGMGGEMPAMNGEMPAMNGEMPAMNGEGMTPPQWGEGEAVMPEAFEENASAETAAYLTELTAQTQTADDSSEDTLNAKGLKSGANLTISGGSVTLNTTDHGTLSTGTTTISGGTLDITSQNKGIKSHGDLHISGGEIIVQQATEAIETKSVMTITDGTVRILNASDDGLNAGGTETDTHIIHIEGGYVYVNAEGDGVDANQTINFNGGTVVVSGPVSGGNGSIDAESMNYNGGLLFALSSRGMMEYPSSGVLVNTNLSAAAGDTICIVNSNGEVEAAFVTPKAVSDVIYGIGDADAAGYSIVVGGSYSGSLNADQFGTGGSVSGGTSTAGTAGTGGMGGGMGGFGGGMNGGMGGFGGRHSQNAQAEIPADTESQMIL